MGKHLCPLSCLPLSYFYEVLLKTLRSDGGGVSFLSLLATYIHAREPRTGGVSVSNSARINDLPSLLHYCLFSLCVVACGTGKAQCSLVYTATAAEICFVLLSYFVDEPHGSFSEFHDVQHDRLVASAIIDKKALASGESALLFVVGAPLSKYPRRVFS